MSVTERNSSLRMMHMVAEKNLAPKQRRSFAKENSELAELYPNLQRRRHKIRVVDRVYLLLYQP